jgi:hypothetical protein
VWDVPAGKELASIDKLLEDVRIPKWTGAYASWHA